MPREAKIKLFLLCTSRYKQDKSLNLCGVENSVRMLDSTMRAFADVEKFSDLESTKAKEQIKEYLSTQDFSETDIFIFYFCGHGFLVGENMNSLLLATSDTTKANSSSEVGIRCEWLLSEIKQKFKAPKTSKYIVVLDCCYSAMACNMGVTWIDSIDLKNYSGAVIITSTEHPAQCSKQIIVKGVKYAAFTYYFSIALKNLLEQTSDFTLLNVMEQTTKLIKKADPSYGIPLPKLNSSNDLHNMIKMNGKPKTDFTINSNEHKLKVLLVKSAIDYPINNYDFGVPLGLWLLKSYMFIQGLDVHIDIFDERLLKVKGEDINFEDIVSNYDVVGVSLCTCEVPQAIKKLVIAKKYGITTFVGGIFTSTNEEYLFSQGCIDYVIPGVSTLPLYNLFKELYKSKIKTENNSTNTTKNAYVSHIPGVATIENLSDSFSLWTPCHLPHIELTIWEEICKRYSSVLSSKIDIFTSRGCNNRCAFCSVQKECAQKVLERDDKSIIDEVDFLYNAGFRHFSIKDEDFFMYGSSRLLNIVKNCHEKHPEITFKIRARIDELMDNNIASLEELYTLGIREIQYGLETPDPNLLAKIKKGYRYENTQVLKFIKRTIETGITANCSFILGIEGESKQYYESLIDFFSELKQYKEKLKVYINFITPHPYRNTFPLENYSIVTNDLKFYTHKNPIAYPKTMVRITRKEMIKTYKEIVKMFDPLYRYNPVIPTEIEEKFIKGKAVERKLPIYSKGNMEDDI